MAQSVPRGARRFFSPGFNPPLRSRQPFVFVVHDLIHLDIAGESTLLKRLYYSKVIRPAARRAFRVLTVSEYSRSRLAEWADIDEQRIVVVGNGVSESFTPDGAAHEPGHAYFLFVGNRKPHKNIRAVLQALSRQPGGSRVRLIMSGEADRQTQAMIKRWGVGDRVDFAGNIDDVRLAAHYRGAVALVIPSFVEGFGLPVVEAMACGTPVLASDAAALPEVAGSAAVLVAPTDHEELARAMTRLLEEPELRSSLRERGLLRAATFSWDRVADRVSSVLVEAQRESDGRSSHPRS